MKLTSKFSRAVALLRYKLFRLMSIVLLGREGGQSVVGQCVSSDLEFANTAAVRDRVLERVLLSESAVQDYELRNVPDCWKKMFARSAVFPRLYAYLLEDVAIGPDSGVVFIPPKRFLGGDGIIFIPSVCHHYFFFQCGIQEVMRKAWPVNESLPVCPMPTAGYYHEMFEGLLRVIKARLTFGDIKVLVSPRRPKYIDEMLEFVGIDPQDIISFDYPVRVSKGVLVPRWSDCGENLKEDVCEFRDYLVSRLSHNTGGTRKLYISRARSRRSLPGEHEFEMALADNGFCVAYFENMPFVEQLKAMHAAEVVVSPHGAGLSNLIVAKSGTKVVEIMTQGWANSCYGHLASSLGLDYTCIDAADERLIERLKGL